MAETQQGEVFLASRWTHGNHIWRTRIIVTHDRVIRLKRHWFSSNEESIAISRVASVNIQTGILWSEIRIDSSGGSNPIVSHGHRKADARRIRDLIEQDQSVHAASDAAHKSE